MAPFRDRKATRLQRTILILPSLAAAMLFSLICASLVNASPVNLCGAIDSGPAPDNLGSIREYMGKDADAPAPSCASLIGINVSEGEGTLASGRKLRGLSVISVERPSPADDAGIESEGIPPLAAAEELGVGVLVIGTVLACPPALLGVGLIPKIKAPKTHDVIVAVDGARTHTVSELEASLRKAVAGEAIYLTVIRDGRRRQIRVVAPASYDSIP